MKEDKLKQTSFEHKQTLAAKNVVNRYINRYPNDLYKVYEILADKIIDTRSPYRREVYQGWLQNNSKYAKRPGGYSAGSGSDYRMVAHG
jgi:hypothetical protein